MGRIDGAERCFGKMRSGRKPFRSKGKKKTRRPGAEFQSDGFVFQLVEMPGVEPGSERTQNQASTCVAPLLNVAEHSAKGQGQCTAKVD